MTIKQFIEKAIEGGWKSNLYTDEQWENVKEMYSSSGINDWQLDPLAWQAVGKVEGWRERYCKSGCGCPEPYGDGSHEFSCVWSGENEWHSKMHRMIDALAEGKSIEEFISTLT